MTTSIDRRAVLTMLAATVACAKNEPEPAADSPTRAVVPELPPRAVAPEDRCVTCHLPPLFTDRSLRDVGTKQALDRGSRFDVPHLNNVYDSAPYLHNGIAETLEEILELQAGREWFWITGNHDPQLPDDLRGHVTPQLTVASIRFRHEPAAGAVAHEIAGHLHPAARVAKRGHTVRRKCFVTDGRRLVMPAFGAYTGGVNVLNESFAPLFPAASFQVWMLGRQDVYPVGKRYLLGD